MAPNAIGLRAVSPPLANYLRLSPRYRAAILQHGHLICSRQVHNEVTVSLDKAYENLVGRNHMAIAGGSDATVPTQAA